MEADNSEGPTITSIVWLTGQVVFAVLVSSILWVVVQHKRRQLPPGPVRIPFYGYVPFKGNETPHVKISKLSEQYGDVSSVHLTGSDVIFLNSHQAIQECLGTNGDQFLGRPSGQNCFLWWPADGMSVSSGEGAAWRENRRFVHHTLTNVTYGNVSLEDRIRAVGEDMVTILEAWKGDPHDTFRMLANGGLNVMVYLTCNRHQNPGLPEFFMLRESVDFVTQNLPSLSDTLTDRSYRSISESRRAVFMHKKIIMDMCADDVKEHEATLDENNIRDLIDAYLLKKREEKKENRSQHFTNERLVKILVDLFMAGFDKPSKTLYWGLRILSQEQDLQAKLHRELDEVIGKDRTPALADKPNLPFTEAFILELLRYSTVLPMGFARSNPEASTLRGFKIPPRCVVFPNLWAANNDPQVFPHPHRFDPNRFLDPTLKDQRAKRLINFSIGNRACLGESLARKEIFLFLTMILQKFTFKPMHLEKEYKEWDTAVRSPFPFELRALKRS